MQRFFKKYFILPLILLTILLNFHSNSPSIEVEAASNKDAVSRFADANLGKRIDFDRAYGAQCADAVRLYIDKYLNIKSLLFGAGGGALPAGRAFMNGQSSILRTTGKSKSNESYYTRVIFKSSDLQRGDIAFFASSNPLGHTGVVTGLTPSRIKVLHQNWPTGSSLHHDTIKRSNFRLAIRVIFRSKSKAASVTPAKKLIRKPGNFVRVTTSDGLKVRTSPCGPHIAIAAKGRMGLLVDDKNYKASCGGKEWNFKKVKFSEKLSGFVASEFIDKSNQIKVTGNFLSLRQSPAGAKVGSLSKGTVGTIIEEKISPASLNGKNYFWVKIKATSNGKELIGFAATEFLTLV